MASDDEDTGEPRLDYGFANRRRGSRIVSEERRRPSQRKEAPSPTEETGAD